MFEKDGNIKHAFLDSINLLRLKVISKLTASIDLPLILIFPRVARQRFTQTGLALWSENVRQILTE